MDKITASEFVYAKATGMYAKAFVGEKIRRLFKAKTLTELCLLVLKEEIPALPESQLADFLEKKVTQNLVKDFINLLSAYDTPDPLSLAILSKYDYGNLKTASHELLRNKPDNSFLVDISPYSIFNWKNWPNLNEIVKNSPVENYELPTKNMNIKKIQEWDLKLDTIYYQSVWDGLQALPKEDKKTSEKLVKMDIILQNIVWILRLRTYYNLKTDEIRPLLLNVRDKGNKMPVSTSADFALDKPLDDWSLWKDWEFVWLLPPHKIGHLWIIDPRWAEFSAQRYLYRLATKQFKSSAFTVGVLISFFRIKQLEEYMIKFATENLKVSGDDSFKNEFFGELNYE